MISGLIAQQKWVPEEFTNSAGKTFMVYPDGKTVTKENYELAKKYSDEASDNYDKKNWSGMKESADKAVLANPYYYKGYSYSGIYFSKVNQYAKAILEYNKALKYSTRKYYLHFNKALNYRKLGKYEEAISSARKVIEINKNYGEAWFELGYCLARVGKNEEALSAYTKAIDSGYSKLNLAYNNRGRCYERMKKYDLARKDYLKALEVDPEYKTAKKNLADLEKIAPSTPGTVWLIAVGINNYVNEYKLSNLSFPTKGAYEFVRIFESRNLLRESAIVLTDAEATRKGILTAMDRLHNSGKVKYNDMVLFFFSGHGEMAGDNIGICPYDYAAPRDLISDGEISKRLNRFVAKHKVAIVEACKTEVQYAAPVPAAKLIKYNNARKSITGGLAYITSTRAGMKSYGTTSGGYFTTHLRNALKSSVADVNGDKVVSLKEMFEYVQSKTSSQTNGEQVPEINRSGFNMNMPMMILE